MYNNFISVRNYSNNVDNPTNSEKNQLPIMLPINTVAVYDNIHLPKVQKQIQIDIKYRSGVYCFQHKVSGKLYIGSSF